MPENISFQCSMHSQFCNAALQFRKLKSVWIFPCPFSFHAGIVGPIVTILILVSLSCRDWWCWYRPWRPKCCNVRLTSRCNACWMRGSEMPGKQGVIYQLTNIYEEFLLLLPCCFLKRVSNTIYKCFNLGVHVQQCWLMLLRILQCFQRYGKILTKMDLGSQRVEASQQLFL